MSQVFLILAHKNPTQVKRLVNKLSHTDSKFVLHIDANCDIEDFTSIFKDTLRTTFFITDRVPVIWGTYKVIEATLNGLNFILTNLSDTKRVTLLSGQDYPIKPIKEILSFFKENDNIYIEYSPLPYKHWFKGGITRFPLYEEISRMIEIYVGSQWWSIPFEVLKKVISELKDYSNFTTYFSSVRIPDESFFQTLLLNMEDEEIEKKLINDNLRLILWKPPYLHPANLRTKDINTIASSEKYFARKFDEKIDEKVLDTIDHILLNSNKESFWENLLEFKDDQHSQAVLMLSNNTSSLRRFNELKDNLPISFNPFLLFHQTDNSNLDEYHDHKYFTFDNSILTSLGFEPLQNSLIPGSNHFPLFSFFHSHPYFDYYWVVEDDVIFNGNWNIFFDAFNPQKIDSDFISSHVRLYYEDPNWYWWNTLQNRNNNNGEIINTKVASFNPIYRISREAIIYLEKRMKDGWIGHHETLIPTLLYNAGFSILDFGGNGQFCKNKMKNLFYRDNICDVKTKIHYSTMRYRPLITEEEITENLLYHPKKDW